MKIPGQVLINMYQFNPALRIRIHTIVPFTEIDPSKEYDF